ncbi:ABC transporter ATP-binding protein [Chlamydiales bacterium]|nr:ABC transporter ATP-binding protein [Chlamydiales bacterium]
MPKKKAVSVHDVSKNFYQGGEVVHALRKTQFEAFCGELSVIIGPSGSGKTTLLSVIAGTLSFDTGTVHVFDYPLEHRDPEKICAFRKKNVGFIFQQFHLIPTLNCQENVSIPLLLQGFSKQESLKRAREMLEEVKITDKINAFPKTLSGGEQQRVAIARALVHRPGLIICDEPTSALDAETGSKIMELIRAHARAKDRCVIVVTHDARIFKYADRMVKMDDGQILTIEENGNHD